MAKRIFTIKQIIMTLSVIGLTGCSNPFADAMNYGITKGRHVLLTPEPAFLTAMDGDDPFSQGWRDGCNTTLGISSFSAVRTHSFAYDVNRGIEDRDYYRGYRLGSDYCIYYTDPEPL